MVTKVAINGFGRIGRLALRAIIESKRKDISVVAINDLGTPDFNAHLLQYDSIHGQFPHKVKCTKTSINAGLGPIKIYSERNPGDLPWGKLDVDIVMECTGIFTDKAKASMHLKAGAKRVLISAPSKDADITVVYGVNHKKIRKSHKVISNASCTTNCLAPVAMVLDKLCGINQGYMTTVHAFTGDQAILDTLHSDKRRARSASQSIIPTSTGAAKAVGLVLPQLLGKLDGTAVRVPTPNVSMIDLVFCLVVCYSLTCRLFVYLVGWLDGWFSFLIVLFIYFILAYLFAPTMLFARGFCFVSCFVVSRIFFI